MNIRNITVIGAGTMGNGIAHICAQSGFRVVLTDIHNSALNAALVKIRKNMDKGIARGKLTEAQRDDALSNIETETDLKKASRDADLIIEAVPENLELKRNLLSVADAASPEHAILATNTSSLSIADIASAAHDPQKVIGTHFFNPVHIMKLLEIVHHKDTDESVIASIQEFGQRIGKTSILVKNAPGFATSRLGVCLGMEAIRMLEEGVASAEDIDTAMVLGYRHPIGPLKLTDLVGLDVRKAIGEYLAEKLNNDAFKPPQLMKDMAEKGHLGQKSKKGFYDWSD